MLRKVSTKDHEFETDCYQTFFSGMVMLNATITIGMETSTLEQSVIFTATKTTNWRELPSKVTK